MKTLLRITRFWTLIFSMTISAALLRSAWAQPRLGMPSASGGQQSTITGNDAPSAIKTGSKVGLVRGIVKRVDPIHDQLWIHPFGGRDLPIAFDPSTKFLSDNSGKLSTSVPAGTVVSVDTVINAGKLFALSVRTSSSDMAELNGQVVRYDPAKARLIVRDPASPETVSLQMTPSTTVVNRGQSASPEGFSAGMLVRVSFSPAQHAAKNIEILAERGSSFTFQGRIVSVDLRSRAVSLFNDSDQSVRELAIGHLDASSLGLLREGADVSIQAEFDGDRYNVRTIALMPGNP